jgi:ATP-dependent RNA helicase RhlE
MSFEKLNLIEPILRALKTEGYTEPTPIQAEAIPVVLKGRDLLGCAQTGTGKTAAFAIPILQILNASQGQEGAHKSIKALILTPTRELAVQIGDSFAAYGRHTGLRHTVIYGGVSQFNQTEALKRGVDILIATPGRLLDLMNQRFIHLHQIKMFVLDEADRMLDMGFINDVKKVISKLPEKRQTLFFSATMPPVISKLADSILFEPVNVEVTPVSSTVDKIQQSVYFVTKSDKKALLIHLLKDKSIETALVFTRTKHTADRIAKELVKAGVKALAIHGNKSQNARQHALNDFKAKKIRVLVATDIAARGIDVDNLSHVINYELPNVPETYVHRIGRTGRAGLSGVAMSFCDGEEKAYLKDIQKVIGIHIPVVESHPYPMSHAEMNTKFEAPKKEQHKKHQSPYPPGSGKGIQHKAGSHWGNKTKKKSGNNSSQPAATTNAPKKHHSGGGKKWGSKKFSGGNNLSY